MLKPALVALALLPALTSAGCPFAPPKPTGKDMHRAHSTKQTERMGGNNHAEIADKINSHLEEQGATLKQCEDFALHELNQLIESMHCHFNEHLSGVYPEEDGRKRRHDTLDSYQQSWEREHAKVRDDPSTEEPLRLAKCAEVLMLYTHHMPKDSRASFMSEFTLPRLPVFDAAHANHPDEEVAQTYVDSSTCEVGHAMSGPTDDGSDHVLPHWPKETHYTGTGHGSYPFWLGNAGAGGSAPIEVWWSESQAAELFYHETCYMSEAGYDGRRKLTPAHRLRGSNNTGPPPPPTDDFGPPPLDDDGSAVSTPCYHLMSGAVGSATGYLYTATEDFCCASTGTTEKLSPSQSDFMDVMTLEGIVDIETDYYSGQGYHYTLSLPQEVVTDFWYTTTLDGYPVQQGEGGTDADSPSGVGIFIYHDYNITTWTANSDVAIDSSKFDIPTICKTTRDTCAMP